tara:strand:- start:354 stop:842 length:489 start_codon:yes stop_codon:yes gene_type:complete
MAKKKNSSKKESIKSLKDKIKDLELLIDKSKEKNILLLAEFDNYKKRIIQERKDNSKYEGSNIFVKVIPVLDDIDRVLDSKLTKDKAVLDGINLIKSKFISILNDFGVSSYNSLKKEFNPDFHEAIMMKKTKGKSNIILEEYEKGYMQHDKVIRYAKVIVSE